ncbi:MAG: DNA-binding protein [Candidatus Lokiarchaeota archaeon]|nr:DNA-binding protein [Candidatus Lokiarchaeota archaeon]
MSDEEELENIRRRKLEELRQQAVQQKIAEQQQNEYEKKKYQLMRQILSQEGRQRLENIRMVKPQFAEQIELQLIQLFQSGRLRGATPLSDNEFKKILEQLTAKAKKKEFNIKK